MIRIEIERSINRPVEEVFDRLINIPAYPDWLPKSRVFIDTKQTSEGPVDEGTTFIDKTRIGLFRGEVADFQRPTHVTFQMMLRWLGMKVLESRPAYTLEPVDGGTKVHLMAVGKLYGIFKLMQPYVAIRAREERKRVVGRRREINTRLPFCGRGLIQQI
jgi:uncharacterized protein YndB with AHSA1/START domain